MTLRTTRGINYYNVKQWRTDCRAAILLINNKRLKGYKKGRRAARGYACIARATTNRSIGSRVRTITCKASKRRMIAWQIKL